MSQKFYATFDEARCLFSLILDFFAGSGTTGQAVLEANRADNGERQFILCTNNMNFGILALC